MGDKGRVGHDNGTAAAAAIHEPSAAAAPAETYVAAVAGPDVSDVLPLYEEVVKCGRCGFCQPTCPVYTATNIEGHVARGKNTLFRGLIEGTTQLDPDLREAFENCLLCRACTTTCFTSIETDRVVVAFREKYGRKFGRPTVQRLIFRRLLPYPRRMSWLIGSLWWGRRLGLAGLAQRLGILRMLNPKLEKAMEIRDEVPTSFLRSRLAKRQPSARTGTGLVVGYWISCGYNYMLPEVGEATVEVLEKNGIRVEVLSNACCGMPVYGYGDVEGARLLARRNLDALGDLRHYDYIVSDCGSCSGHLKEYAHLLAADARYAERAAEFVGKVRAFSELVHHLGLEACEGEVPAVVTYHDPCHLGPRYQNVVRQPRELIKAIRGVDFRELREADWCCGAAGSYNFMHNEISMKIMDRKVDNVEQSGADIVATECPACMMQLALGVKRHGLDTRVLSVSQLMCQAQQTTSGHRPSEKRG